MKSAFLIVLWGASAFYANLALYVAVHLQYDLFSGVAALFLGGAIAFMNLVAEF